ncbi:PREDICTED: zinc finger protein 831 isoform X2 [Dipodomys ordii]|uniref:Zinc finger protein 831 isoform X2 n=1 Tax=Dipodomys ordii TaxID=10020 RepID=A0A1S3FTC2_DIPOR|nr:PREDICTED: zinc finger protein 831 isoform X2 [Dipodomys ordii]
METPEPSCPGPSAKDKPIPVVGLPGASSGQASPRLTLGPVILPQEQGLHSAVFLKALPIPLYHTVPPGGLQPRAPLVTGSVDAGGVPFILSPLLQPEGPGPSQGGKLGAPTLTVNIVGALPVLSPGLGPTLGSPGKAKNAGKYLCPHCSRDCLKPSVLEKHIRSHTGERPFPCATCGIAFKTQSNLYKHRRTQTHLNNSRLSLESEAGRSSLGEEESRVREPPIAESGSQGAERALSPGLHLSPAAQSLEMKTEAAPCPGATPAHREAPADHTQMASPGLPLASPQPRRKILEPKPCSLPRQQETTSEKPWDTKASEGRLRKCESTDSGYLSRSDSAEQPPVTSSPLHSLSEHSVESEGEGGPGPGLGAVEAEAGAPGPSLELERKQLEERIARLISHNQAVVDDPQLDHVRPRKTVLSKQGSIDLPMPYTYKDSFHFDIRALEPGRRRAVHSPAPSTFPPLDKSRPLFFHSVPTQLSTAVECVPVTRSNSLPFVEGSRTWPEPRDLGDIFPRMQKPPSPRLPPARLGCRSRMTLADVPSGHPRALVRQAAVEEMLCVSGGDTSAPAEDLDRSVCKGHVASRKGRPRKGQMFSQEKWQVYGHETFERIYQKTKSSHQGGQKSREVRGEPGTEPHLAPQEEAAGADSAAPAQVPSTSVHTAASAEARWGAGGNLPTPENSSEAQPAPQGKAAAGARGSNPPRQATTASPSPLGSGVPPSLGTRSALLPPDGRPEPLPGEGPRTSGPAVPDATNARQEADGEAVKISPWAQAAPRRLSGSAGEPPSAEDKLPSERKKLRVDGTGLQEQLGPPGVDTPGGPVRVASLPSQMQGSDPQGGSERSREGTKCPADPLAHPGQTGSRGEEPTPRPAPRVSGPHLQLAPHPGTPEAPVALTHSTFPPKYLLRLPQGETHPPPPIPPLPGQHPDSPCSSGQLKGQASAVGSVPGSAQPPDPALGPTPGEAEGLLEDPSRPRPRDRGEEAQAGSEKGDRVRAKVPDTRDSPSLAPGLPWEPAPFPPTPTGHGPLARDSAIHLSQDSTSAEAQGPGGLLNSWVPPQEPVQPHKNAPEDSVPEPLAELRPCCPSQSSSSRTALTRPQGWAPSLPEPCLPGGRAQSPFPSLRAEPRLTWCCLSRSLPLPAEQKERAESVYSSWYCPGSHLQAEGPLALPTGTRGWIRTSPGAGKPAPQTPELCYPAVQGMRCRGLVSDPERKKGPWRRRVKASRGSSKQKKPRLHPKRCEGSFWQSHTQLRASRLHKLPWGPRGRCLPPLLKGQEPRGPLRRASSEMAGVSLRGDPSDAQLSLGHGNEERKEEDCGLCPETFTPSESSRPSREMDRDTSLSTGEHGDCSHLDVADASGLSVQPPTGSTLGKAEALLQDKGLDFVLLPSQDHDAIDPRPCISSDAQASSSSECKGTAPYQAIATSVAAACIPLGVQGTDVQAHHQAVEEAQPQSSPDGRVAAEATALTSLTETPLSGQKAVGLALLGSPRKTHLEIPASGPSSASSPQEEGRHQTAFPSSAQYRGGDTAIPCPALGLGSGKCQPPGLISLRGSEASPSLGQPSEFPEAPSRSVRKRSLEGMRKQTRVELSDTSSDDEGRLVIEI